MTVAGHFGVLGVCDGLAMIAVGGMAKLLLGMCYEARLLHQPSHRVQKANFFAGEQLGVDLRTVLESLD